MTTFDDGTEVKVDPRGIIELADDLKSRCDILLGRILENGRQITVESKKLDDINAEFVWDPKELKKMIERTKDRIASIANGEPVPYDIGAE